MSELYCDVSLPVPMDQPFTYALPETLRHRVRPGCRVTVPFGVRKLTGVVVRCHSEPPDTPARGGIPSARRRACYGPELMALGRWMASYYCAPLGEVLRTMTPLGARSATARCYVLTDAGPRRDAPAAAGRFRRRPGGRRSCACSKRVRFRRATCKAKLPLADRALRSLEKKGLIQAENLDTDRDPSRASSARFRVEFKGRPADVKLTKRGAGTGGVSGIAPRLAQSARRLESTVEGAGPGGAIAGAQRPGRAADRAAGVGQPGGPRAARAQSAPARGLRPHPRRPSRRASSRPSCCTASPDRARPKSTCGPSKPRWRWAAARCCWFPRSR